MSAGGGGLFSLFLLFLALSPNGASFAHANGSVSRAENSTVAVVAQPGAEVQVEEAEMVPFIEAGKAEIVMMVNETRRKLGSFQICALCTCCGGAKGYCLPSPCCYAINCNIPNRPFGFCSFTPKTCNCLGCKI